MERSDKKEEYAKVLDFMLTGKPFSNKAEPLSQVVGELWFTLLEVIPKDNVTLTLNERVYIGMAERDKIAMIKARIPYEKLTQTAKNELPIAVEDIIRSNEQRFVEFFNKAAPLNIREHSLALLPGIGKKYLQLILQARKEKPFESFVDISARIPSLPDPVKVLSERVLQELQGNERFYLFAKPFNPLQQHQQ
ncbi:MAG: DUF655 domain-containing protein [Candidatus Micrarchaeia archaeon]